jgi:hypothetical protein
MSALSMFLTVCVLVGVIAIIAQRIRKARSIETEMALMLEEDYRGWVSFGPPETVSHATRFVEGLTDLLNPKHYFVFKNPELTYRVEAARILAVSNMVAGLETYSGKSYGTNIQAWQDWLDAQVPGGNGQR